MSENVVVRQVALVVGRNPSAHPMMHHISAKKNIFNDKLCSVGRVSPACSPHNLVRALVQKRARTSEMPLPAGKGLKNMQQQLFEVTCSQLLSQHSAEVW